MRLRSNILVLQSQEVEIHLLVWGLLGSFRCRLTRDGRLVEQPLMCVFFSLAHLHEASKFIGRLHESWVILQIPVELHFPRLYHGFQGLIDL